MLELAGSGAMAAAILLPLYHLVDATLTLLRRLARREKVWEAHRSHFYQQATANGYSALAVSAQVFCLNLVLLLRRFGKPRLDLPRLDLPRLHKPRLDEPRPDRPSSERSS
jgi:hypothetical protein